MSATGDEVGLLICLPVEGDPVRYITPGSEKRECNDCGTKVWVAPSGQKLIKEKAPIVACMNCACIRMKKEAGHLEITGDQIEEIRVWKRRN
ncbi:hypothetical protein ES704_01646 [subsurface metagenome]|jgi:hypothetical protein